MSARALSHVATRPKVLWPLLIGVALVVGKVSLLFGVMLVAFAVWKAARLLADPRLEDLLRLREQKLAHGICRMLYDGERREIFALDAYGRGLAALGADPALAGAVMHEAWSVIAAAGEYDASARLTRLREGLPSIASLEANSSSQLAQRISTELNVLHATRKELEDLG